jgi:hypothetical protein
MRKVIRVDEIVESSSGAGVTIAGVHLHNGSIDGVIPATTSNEQYSYYTNPLTGLKIRVGNRGGTLVTDSELQLNGFTLGEGVGWENVVA